jgi:hypothetical protein
MITGEPEGSHRRAPISATALRCLSPWRSTACKPYLTNARGDQVPGVIQSYSKSFKWQEPSGEGEGLLQTLGALETPPCTYVDASEYLHRPKEGSCGGMNLYRSAMICQGWRSRSQDDFAGPEAGA